MSIYGLSRKLGIKKFEFDIGDVVYYHYTGRHFIGGQHSFTSTPYAPLSHSCHLLVVDYYINSLFFDQNCNLEEMSEEELSESIVCVLKAIPDGSLYHVEKKEQFFLETRDEKKDFNQNILTYKIFSISEEDQEAFKRVIKLTSWYYDSRKELEKQKKDFQDIKFKGI